MIAGQSYDFLCPYCNGENTLTTHKKSAMKEEKLRCRHCGNEMSVIAAAGMENDTNVIAFESGEVTYHR